MEGDDANVRRGASEPASPGALPEREAARGYRAPANCGVGFPVSVVLPAGGTGERTGLPTPKQFCRLLGRPLISYTIQAFERVPWIQSVVVAVAKENIDLMMGIVRRFRHAKVRVVPGGATRHRSICNGVLALDEEAGGKAVRPEVVIIHDAVRPFVEEDFLQKIAMAAKEHGAAGAVRPLVSTVIAATSEGFLDHSLERAKYRASEMPQGFAYDVILRAYQRCTESDLEFGTECLHLALQYCGTSARLVEGPPTLWKVTYRRDLAAAESIVKEKLSRSACLVTDGSESAKSLAGALRKAAGVLEMELDVVPDLAGGGARCLLNEWNFIRVSIGASCLSDVEALLAAVEAVERPPLHTPVIVWVHTSAQDEPSVSGSRAKLAAFAGLASAAKLRNILLYGVQLQHSKNAEDWEGSASRVAQITSALIRERSHALVGQLLLA